MTALSNLTVLVRSMRYEAQGIVSLELVPLPPALKAGKLVAGGSGTSSRLTMPWAS